MSNKTFDITFEIKLNENSCMVYNDYCFVEFVKVNGLIKKICLLDTRTNTLLYRRIYNPFSKQYIFLEGRKVYLKEFELII